MRCWASAAKRASMAGVRFVAVGVVVGGERGGFGELCGRVEGARGQLADVERVAGDVPVDVVGGDEVEAPGFDPALPAGVVSLSRDRWPERGARGWKTWKTLPVADGPGGKGRESEQDADDGDASELLERDGAVMVAGGRPSEQSAGARATATSAPSGRRSAAKVTAKVKPERTCPAGPVAESGPWPRARGRARRGWEFQ